MAVGVLVIVPLRQFAQLPAEALVAGIVDAAGAPAITAPVAEAFGDHLELLIAHDIHRAALAHGEVVGRVETLGAQVTPGAGPAHHPIRALIEARAVLRKAQAFGQAPGHGVAAAQGIAVVFHQPQFVLLAEGQGGGQIEGIAQGVGHHHGLGFARAVGRLQLIAAGIAGDGIGIDENRHRSHLHDRRHRGGEARRHCDHLIAGLEAPGSRQLGRGERRDRYKVGAGARVHQQAVAHPQKCRKLLLEGVALLAKGEPKIKGARYRSFHLIFREHPAGIGDSFTFLPGGAIEVCGGAETGVNLAGVFAGEAQNLLAHGCCISHAEEGGERRAGRRCLVVQIGAEVLVEFLSLRP